MIAPNDAQQCYHDDDIGLTSLVDNNPDRIARSHIFDFDYYTKSYTLEKEHFQIHKFSMICLTSSEMKQFD